MIDLQLLETVSETGLALHDLVVKLFPYPRSITGDGVRDTLRMLQEVIPLEIHEVPTGTQVFDWQVPKEWNIRDAYIKNSRGERIVDFHASNLHVLSYSIPVHGYFSLAELTPHLYSLPDQPDLIPYRTSFYQEKWGFCLSHHLLESLEEDTYEVCIDSSLEAGHLTYGEYFLPGESSEEILISTHTCHPSLANDNLSAIAVCAYLARHLQGIDRRYSYRFVFVPATIGPITWLATNQARLENIRFGLVASLLGDSGPFTYKRSRQGNSLMDQAVEQVLKDRCVPHEVIDFIPYGYDERQYCSPGINLGVGNLTRTPFGQFPEYHTSADDINFVRPEFLAQSLGVYVDVMMLLEKNRTYQNLKPYCEPQLGKRGLYNGIWGMNDRQMAMLWLLNLSDGEHSLLDIARRSQTQFSILAEMAGVLTGTDLLIAVD